MILSAAKVFGTEHIIYVSFTILIIVGLFVLLPKLNLTEQKKEILFRGLGTLLFICILINRISVTYYDVVINKREGYSWLNLIPNTYCGFCSLVLSITFMFGKKDNFILHSIGYLGMCGGFITIFYPDFLDSQAFFDIRSITGLLHHTLMFILMFFAIVLGYMRPTIKKVYYFLLGIIVIILIGLLELYVLGFKKGMQLNEPLIKSLPILTSWYVVDVTLVLCHFIFLVLYEVFHNKKTLKSLFK